MNANVLVTLARVAERAERYDEMASYMKQRVELGGPLDTEESERKVKACKPMFIHSLSSWTLNFWEVVNSELREVSELSSWTLVVLRTKTGK